MDLVSIKLFNGIAKNDIEAMLNCLRARITSYEKGQVILDNGQHTDNFAIVLDGSVSIVQEDYWGNRNILSILKPGDIFGEAFAALPDSKLNVTVIAENATSILFINFNRILTTCSNSCAFHSRVINNLFVLLARKNRFLNEKLTHISQRSTKEKILSFLTTQARHCGSNTFSIPMNRQQMADYLSVDRSALSNELSKLKNAGLIDYHKNSFKIIQDKHREP